MTSLTKCAWLRLNGLTCGIWIISSEFMNRIGLREMEMVVMLLNCSIFSNKHSLELHVSAFYFKFNCL